MNNSRRHDYILPATGQERIIDAAELWSGFGWRLRRCCGAHFQFADFITLASNFGQTYSPPAPQPQPAAAMTLAAPSKVRKHRSHHRRHNPHLTAPLAGRVQWAHPFEKRL